MKRLTIAIQIDLEADKATLDRAREAVIGALEERSREGILPDEIECEKWAVGDMSAQDRAIREIASLDTWSETVVAKLIDEAGYTDRGEILEGTHAAQTSLDDLIASDEELQRIIIKARRSRGDTVLEDGALVDKMLAERGLPEPENPEEMAP